ncbi:MAG: UDP-N-acetylmuramate--L-alanine ligase [Bacteroidales bacterium]|nr:UDP-N-acetylmuramate--L-alanine ligase [Bacteroidales bacterium]
MNQFENIKYVYLLGIGGIGMSALARYFNEGGLEVYGYDLTESPLTKQLESEGITITYDDDIDRIPDKLVLDIKSTMVIFTPAVPKNNRHFCFFSEGGYLMYKRAKVLGMIANGYKTIAVSGTHGKTTNSCTIANIFQEAGLDSFAFLGGISKNINSNLLLPRKSESFTNPDTLLVAEADEYDKSFLWLNPFATIITYVDADHLDIYKNRDEIIETFNQFAQSTHHNGFVVVNKKIESLINTGSIRKITYSDTDTTADYYAENIRLDNGTYTIDAHTPSGVVSDLAIGAKGRVNIENTMACIAACENIGIKMSGIRKGIATFRGVKRRMDIHVQTPDFVYIDDYAHHPRELEATITSAKQLFPGKKSLGIFQPHLFTRTRDFAEGFAQSLDLLDDVILMDIYPAREKPIPGVTSQMIADMMKNKNVIILNELSQIISYIQQKNTKLLLSLGAGNIDKIVKPLTEAFSNL